MRWFRQIFPKRPLRGTAMPGDPAEVVRRLDLAQAKRQAMIALGNDAWFQVERLEQIYEVGLPTHCQELFDPPVRYVAKFEDWVIDFLGAPDWARKGDLGDRLILGALGEAGYLVTGSVGQPTVDLVDTTLKTVIDRKPSLYHFLLAELAESGLLKLDPDDAQNVP